MKKLRAIMALALICITMASCSKQANDANPVKPSQSSTITATTKQAEKDNAENQSTAIVLNESKSKDIVANFYGKTFTAKLEKKGDDFAKYKVFDKMNNLYSVVTIDYNTSTMKEEIFSTGEVNEYDLNSLNTED